MTEHAGFVGGDAAIDIGGGEHRIDRAEHIRPGAERVVEPHLPPSDLGSAEQRREISPHLLVFARRRALERKDRLLLVADREQGAGEEAARARPGGEFRHQMAHDPPLLLAGVLGLVDQDMVEPEVELVMHPARIDLRQHVAGLVDEIVVIEQPAAVLLGAVACDHRARNDHERRGAVAANDGLAALDQALQAVLLGAEPARQFGIIVGERSGDHPFARLDLVGEKNTEIFVHPQRA